MDVGLRRAASKNRFIALKLTRISYARNLDISNIDSSNTES